MSLLDFTVNTATCTRCGECVADCSARIITMEEGVPTIAPDKEAACYRCQYCLAICPADAVSILGVGTVWNGLTKWAVNDLLPETRQRLGIPEEHVIGYVMSFGRPALKFQRTVQHGPAAINRVVI